MILAAGEKGISKLQFVVATFSSAQYTRLKDNLECLMYSTGKFAKRVGIEPNTMVVWLREGIVIPAPKKGRNNQFTEEEAVVIKAIVPLYLEWGLSACLLRNVAAFLREILSQREDCGFESPSEFMTAIRAARIATWANNVGSVSEEIAKVAADWAQKDGLTLPQNWMTEGLEEPDLGGGTFPQLNNYDVLMGLALGVSGSFGDAAWLCIANNGGGEEWQWFLDYGKHPHFEPRDASSYIVVDLKRALSGEANS